MTDFAKYVPQLVLQHLTANEKRFLAEVFTRFNGYPSLEQLWHLMDEQWIAHDCDPKQMDERVAAFYQHPVWILNGLFIEQHAQSLESRRMFTDWVLHQAPVRVADFGGGFGGLARFIGEALPNAQVEVVEPHPHSAAIALAASTPNVRFVPELSGGYDILIATDVFEHVPDPIGLAAETASFLRDGGVYLMANCFAPVIMCHLPQLFHFNMAWDSAMQAMGLQPGERVGYGRAFRPTTSVFNIDAASRLGDCAKSLYPVVRLLPRGQARIGNLLMRSFCR